MVGMHARKNDTMMIETKGRCTALDQLLCTENFKLSLVGFLLRFTADFLKILKYFLRICGIYYCRYALM